MTIEKQRCLCIRNYKIDPLEVAHKMVKVSAEIIHDFWWLICLKIVLKGESGENRLFYEFFLFF